jgi:hypothetical protein
VLAAVRSACARLHCPLQFAGIRELYNPRYEYEDLAAHRALITVPYQVLALTTDGYTRS